MRVADVSWKKLVESSRRGPGNASRAQARAARFVSRYADTNTMTISFLSSIPRCTNRRAKFYLIISFVKRPVVINRMYSRADQISRKSTRPNEINGIDS